MNRPTAGLDLSLTGTGISVAHPVGPRMLKRITSKPCGKSIEQTLARLRTLAGHIDAYIPHSSVVAIEGPSFGSHTGSQHERGGLWWMVADRLHTKECRLIVVPPTTRAKYATGRGNAGKDEVLAAVIRRHTDLDIRDNDTADAVILNHIAARLAGHPIDGDMPAAHLAALKGLTL